MKPKLSTIFKISACTIIILGVIIDFMVTYFESIMSIPTIINMLYHGGFLTLVFGIIMGVYSKDDNDIKNQLED